MAIEWLFVSISNNNHKKSLVSPEFRWENASAYPSHMRIRARGLKSVALPPKLLRRGFPHSLACNASHFSTSRHACSLFALWSLMMWSISCGFKSSFFHRQPFRNIAFQNICWLGYTQNSFVPSSVTFGMLDTWRSFGNGNGWSGAGFWLAGGICASRKQQINCGDFRLGSRICYKPCCTDWCRSCCLCSQRGNRMPLVLRLFRASDILVAELRTCCDLVEELRCVFLLNALYWPQQPQPPKPCSPSVENERKN